MARDLLVFEEQGEGLEQRRPDLCGENYRMNELARAVHVDIDHHCSGQDCEAIAHGINKLTRVLLKYWYNIWDAGVFRQATVQPKTVDNTKRLEINVTEFATDKDCGPITWDGADVLLIVE